MFSSYILSLGLGLQFWKMGLIMTLNSNCWEDYPSSENLTVYHTSVHVCVCACTWSLSCVRLSAIPWTCTLPGFSVHGIFQARILERAAISYSRKWSRNLPNLRIKPESLASPALAGGFFTTVPPTVCYVCMLKSRSTMFTVLRNCLCQEAVGFLPFLTLISMMSWYRWRAQKMILS